MNPSNPKELKTERDRNFERIENFLKERKVKSERVLGFVCFEHGGKSHRVHIIEQAKKIFGVGGY